MIAKEDLKKEGYERCDFTEGMFGRVIINDLIDKAYNLGFEDALNEDKSRSRK